MKNVFRNTFDIINLFNIYENVYVHFLLLYILFQLIFQCDQIIHPGSTANIKDQIYNFVSYRCMII